MRRRWTSGGVVGLWLLLLAASSQAVVVERVVAVVGEKAILLTDLRVRARPFLLRMMGRVPPGPQRVAAESRLLGEMLQRMVDDRLEAHAAVAAGAQVDAGDVDKALHNVARASGNLTLSQLFERITKETGMTEVEYRQEIRRQVLEGKLLGRMVQNQRITKKEMQQMFERVVAQERRILLFDPRWIVLRVGDKPTKELLAARLVQARELVARIRAGADFGALARQYSDDEHTADKGGDLGIRAPVASPKAMTGRYGLLAPPLQQRVMTLEPGQVSEPVRFRDALVILKLESRQPSRYTTWRAARREMIERVRGDKLQRAKAKWLRDLRRTTHVDVRL